MSASHVPEPDAPEASPRPGDPPPRPPVQHRQRDDRRHHAQHAEHHHGELERGGGRDEPGVDVDAGATSRSGRPPQSVKTPATWGFFSADSVPVAPGIPTKSAPTPPDVGPDVQRAARLRTPPPARGATAATESRNATTTVSALARTNRPLRPAVDAAGRNRGEHQAAGRGQGGDRLAGDRRRRGPAVRPTPAAR